MTMEDSLLSKLKEDLKRLLGSILSEGITGKLLSREDVEYSLEEINNVLGRIGNILNNMEKTLSKVSQNLPETQGFLKDILEKYLSMRERIKGMKSEELIEDLLTKEEIKHKFIEGLEGLRKLIRDAKRM